MALILAALLLNAGRLAAQTNDFDVGGMLDAAQQFAQDNLDPDVLSALQSVDRAQVEDFLDRFQSALKNGSVPDLAPLKDAANIVLPLLDAHAETRPTAAWLRARLDYFTAADELKPPATGRENGRTSTAANPAFKAQQEFWGKIISQKSLPKNADEFVPRLKTIFAAEGVPVALVWLAEVESGFDAAARSPAGAVGLFQLMPATARQYGLSLWPRDQRRQAEPAARAAAQDLRQLHEQFGDWRLAVAAYNSGPGTVERLLKKNQATSYEDIASHLPAETQLYVPKVEATIRHREGADLESLKAPPA